MQNSDNNLENKESIPHIFLFMWDMYGLEFCQDITSIEKRNMIKALKGEQLERPFNLNALLMRARLNSQRNYEMYTMTVEQGITEENVIEWFESNPQYAVDQIRSRGKKLYGSSSNIDPVIR
jgi:hypothetical protein